MMELVPTEHMPYFYLGPLLVQVGDTDGYQRHCERILAQFTTNLMPMAAERIAKACLVLPPPQQHLERVYQLASFALNNGKAQASFAYVQFIQGLDNYLHGK